MIISLNRILREIKKINIKMITLNNKLNKLDKNLNIHNLLKNFKK